MSVPDPFRAVHRARRRRALGLSLTGALAASALAAVVWLVPAAVAAPASVATGAEDRATPWVAPTPGEASATIDAPAPAAAPSAAGVGAPTVPEQTPADGGAAPATQLAAPAPPVGQTFLPAPSPSAPLTPGATAGPRDYTIAVDTAGYQSELDRCLWVRMDLVGASAPIVGAHNNCGGAFVLDLLPGDTVTLTGQNLDGPYVVVDSRDGRPGQNASEATADFPASVILQTCYFDGPDVRLVALARVA